MPRTEKKRRYDREWKRKRYAEDPDYRAKIISATNAYAKTHRPQINARLRKRYASDPAFRAACSATRRGVELKKYGLTQETYDKLLVWQGGACLICGRPAAKRRLCVDHCHVSDLIRALLCHGCNTAAGSVGDDPVVARRLADFLELWQQHLHTLGMKKENNMTADEDVAKEGKTAILIRRALEHELHQPFGVEPSPPGTWLHALARALVVKAGQSDVQALKEVFDRASGTMAAGPAGSDYPRLVNVPWKVPSLLSSAPIPAAKARPRRKTSRSPNDASAARAHKRAVGPTRAGLDKGQGRGIPVRPAPRNASTGPNQTRPAVSRPAKSSKGRRLS